MRAPDGTFQQGQKDWYKLPAAASTGVIACSTLWIKTQVIGIGSGRSLGRAPPASPTVAHF